MKLPKISKYFYYNKETKELVFKINKISFLCFNVDFFRWAIPLYVAVHWKGLTWKNFRDPLKREVIIKILCLNIEHNCFGPIIQDNNKKADDFFRIW